MAPHFRSGVGGVVMIVPGLGTVKSFCDWKVGIFVVVDHSHAQRSHLVPLHQAWSRGLMLMFFYSFLKISQSSIRLSRDRIGTFIWAVRREVGVCISSESCHNSVVSYTGTRNHNCFLPVLLPAPPGGHCWGSEVISLTSSAFSIYVYCWSICFLINWGKFPKHHLG